MEQLGSHWTEKAGILGFFQNWLRKFKFDQNMTRIMGTLHDDLHILKEKICWILLSKRNVSNKSCTESQNTYL